MRRVDLDYPDVQDNLDHELSPEPPDNLEQAERRETVARMV